MLALVTFIVVLLISLIIVRVATVALTLTGLSQDIARFQARSAWTGTGFTTGEAERVLNHPMRRRVISVLMVARSAGLVTAASTLVLSFANAEDEQQTLNRVLIAVIALFILWIASMSSWVDHRLSALIRKLLTRFTDLEVKDYASLLHLTDRYSVARLMVEKQDWLAGRRLKELNLPDEGVVVLGIERADGSYTGAPRGETDVREGDTLLLYARLETLRDLDERPQGLEGQARHYQQAAMEKEREAAADDDNPNTSIDENARSASDDGEDSDQDGRGTADDAAADHRSETDHAAEENDVIGRNASHQSIGRDGQ